MTHRRLVVLVPEPEWEPSHRLLDDIAEVRIGDPGVRYGEQALAASLADVDAVIITSQHKVSRPVLEAAPRLKAVVKYGSRPGIDNVDLAAATEHGVVVSYTPDANSDSVAEHTITLMLALLKRVYPTAVDLRQGRWRDLSRLGRDLGGKGVGIIGFGSVGRRVAKKLLGFGVELLVHDPYVQPEAVQDVGARLVGFDELLERSDIVTVHATLTDASKHLIDARALARCKAGAVLVNTARGGLVDEAALVAALSSGHLAGAALDVFEQEPPSGDSPLLHMDNVLATPHTASCTIEAYQKEADMAVEEVRSVLQGNRPRFAANPEVFSRLTLR